MLGVKKLVTSSFKRKNGMDISSLRTADVSPPLIAAEGHFARRNICDSATEIPY